LQAPGASSTTPRCAQLMNPRPQDGLKVVDKGLDSAHALHLARSSRASGFATFDQRPAKSRSYWTARPMPAAHRRGLPPRQYRRCDLFRAVRPGERPAGFDPSVIFALPNWLLQSSRSRGSVRVGPSRRAPRSFRLLDRALLEKTSCVYYQVVKREFDRLLPPAPRTNC
jgi:hypothetical protein